MAEYINKEELIENLNKFAPEHFNTLINLLITKQPAADVVEVKHGYWIGNNGNMAYDDYRCSCCGNYTDTRNQFLLGWYCSFCGAKMDGRSDIK